jgi:sialate O-acetylesterase
MLAGIFQSGMVLQRNKPVPIWGWTGPRQKVIVTFRDQSVTTTADATGRWKVELDPLEVGGPDEMGVFYESDDTILSNILVGDVWLISGQSNMVFPVSQVTNSTSTIETATNSNIRYFKVGFQSVDSPLDVIKSGFWRVTSPSTVGPMSGVGYFFARSVASEMKVPIGLIDASFGGSTAEAWIPRASLAGDQSFAPILERYDKAKRTNRVELDAYRREAGKPRPEFQIDTGNRGYALGYHAEKFDDSRWSTMPVPGYWEDHDKTLKIDGAVWYRREVTIPPEYAGFDLDLELGQLADVDITYWNGQRVGFTAAGEEDPAGLVRHYTVPGRMVKAGKAVLAVRVFNRIGKGGFVSQPEEVRLRSSTSIVSQSLAGPWKFKVEKSLDPAIIRPLEIPFGPGHPAAPSNLYNGMIHPIMRGAIAGVVWYQGESNIGRGKQYEALLQRLITTWRNKMEQGTLPFYVVQLPHYRTKVSSPSESDWAEIREAQRRATRLARTHLVVTIDTGDPKDIHPRDKQPIGDRVALAALQTFYGITNRGLSPMFDGLKHEGTKVRLMFSNTVGSMKTSDGGPIRGLAIAGADKKFYWASTQIEGEAVLAWHPLVPEPKSIRYAWADHPDANLVNRAGLPAAPFRTDDWPLLSENRF